MTSPAESADLARSLTDLKNRNGLSYAALARRLNVSRSALHRYCSGLGAPPPLSLVERFAQVCDASPDEVAQLRGEWALTEQPRTSASPAPLSSPLVGAHPGDEALLTNNAGAHQGDLVSSNPSTRPGGAVGSDGDGHSDRDRRGTPVPGGRRHLPVLATGLVVVAIAVWAGLRLTGHGDAERDGQEREIQAAATAGPSPYQSPGGPSCEVRQGVQYVDDRQDRYVWTTDYLCRNRGDSALYEIPGGKKSAIMQSAESWFVCWATGPGNEESIWYYTRGDRAEPGFERLNGWGFMQAKDVALSEHPFSQMPRCWFTQG